jgi:RHS repeat-associated protein
MKERFLKCCLKLGLIFTLAYCSVADWNPYGPTTHSLTLPDGDYVEVTVQGISNIMFWHNGTGIYTEGGRQVKQSSIVLYGHYSNKREPFVVSGKVVPGSGPFDGWFRANQLRIYMYHRCEADRPSDTYHSASAPIIWKPEQTGDLMVTGSGGYNSECPGQDLAMLNFQGSASNGLVREIFVHVKGNRPLPSVTLDDSADPDYEFSLNYGGDAFGPPGNRWLVPEDDGPPYDDSADGVPGLPDEVEGEGPGACSPFGLPLYRVDASDLSVAITDRMFAYNSLGPDLSFIHSHRSRKAGDGMLGSRWFFSYEQKVIPIFPARAVGRGLESDIWVDPNTAPTAAIVHLGNGLTTKFTFSATNANGERTYVPEDPYLKAELVLMSDAWELRRHKPRLTHRFELVPTLITYPVGRLTSIADKFGNELSFKYESDFHGADRNFWLIRSMTDAVGRVTTFSYTNGLCTTIQMPNGLTASYSYDENSLLTETVDLLGNKTTYTYDPWNPSITKMESAGKVVQFTYEWGRLTELIDPQGNHHSFTSPTEDETSYVSAAGHMLTTTVNSDQLPIRQTNTLGQTSEMTYVEKRPSEIVIPHNRRISLSYDAAGNRTGYRNPMNQTTKRAFDEKNRLVSITNPLGEDLLFSYGHQDQLLSVTRPSGGKVSYQYNAQGLLASSTNEIGGITRYQYDAHGNLSRATSPTGGVTTYRYDPFGLYLTSIVNANGNTTSYAYDANGRITRVQFADSTSQTFHYDCCSLVGITDADGRLHSIQRDEKLYVTDFTREGSATTSFAYDGDGRQTGVSNSSGQSSSVNFDELGRPAALITPAGRFQLSYDDMWNITGITNPTGNTWGFGYNDARQLIAETDPLGRRVTYARDGLGRTTATTNADGSVVRQTYTVDGDPHILTIASGDVHRNEYNAAGWVTAQHSPQGSTSFEYDAAGRVTRLGFSGGLTVEKSYDANGNLTGMVYPDGTAVSYQHDRRDRISKVNWNGGSVSIGYSASSRVIAINRANNVNTILQRNQDDLVTSLTHGSSSRQLARIELVRDSLGRVTQLSTAGDLLPLPDLSLESSSDWSYNRADGLAQMGGSAVQSDLNGNITAIPALGSSYSYDALNRVRSITTDEGTSIFAYDGNNRLIRNQSPQQSIRFFYDESSRLLFATDDDHQLLWINVFAGQMLLAQQGSALGLRYYHYSELGHTMLLTDRSGSVVKAFAYTPFGVSSQAFSSDREWFTLSGSFAVIDLGRGHYHMQHRLYQASVGRFLQRDPIGLAGGANLFAYSGSDPVNAIDPFGLSGWMYDEMNSLRDEFDSQNEVKSTQRYARVLRRVWDLEQRDNEKWTNENPIKAWASEQLIDKGLMLATGGVSKYVGIYEKYQQGKYVDLALGPYLGKTPGLDEARSLLENLYRSYRGKQSLPDTLPRGGSFGNWNNLGGAGTPQCLVEYGTW